MSRKPLRYYLFSQSKRPLYVDDSGHVLEGSEGAYTRPNGQPAHLEVDPQGFSESAIKYARNDRYHGIFRSYSQALRFVGPAAKILRRRMWTHGVEGVTYLNVLRMDLRSLPYTYKPEYVSELNFTKYSETKDGVTVEALEGGLSKLFKAYETTTYEIPIGTDAQSVKLDGLFLEETNNFSIFPASMQLGHFLSAALVSTEGEATGFAGFQVAAQSVSGNMDKNTNPNYLFAFGQPVAGVRMRGKISFKLTGVSQPPAYMRVLLVSNKGKEIKLVDLTKPAIGNRHDTTIDLTFDAAAGENFFLIGDCGDFSSGAKTVVEYQETTFSLYFKSRYTTTYVKGYYLSQLLEKLVRKLSDGKYGARSAWLSGKRDIIITSGDAVRNLPGAVIKVSMSDLFQILNFWSVGLGIEGDEVVVEPLSYFYRGEVVLKLTDVASATIDIAEDRLFNTVAPGFEEEQLDDVNGRYAFCQPQQWTLPATRKPEALDLTVPAMADPYAIEHLRIQTAGKDTTGNSGDNKCVLLHVTPAPAFSASVAIEHSESGVFTFNAFSFEDTTLENKFLAGTAFSITGTTRNNGRYTTSLVMVNDGKLIVFVEETVQNETVTGAVIQSTEHSLYRDASVTITGVPDPVNVFNISLRPRNAIVNNGALIRSVMDFQDTGKVAFQSAVRNAELSTTVAGVTIKEKDAIQIGALSAPLFRPYLIKLKTALPLNALELLKVNPYGKVEFPWRGRTYRGFLTDGGQRIADNAEQEWTLLSAPENDLLKFNDF
jgi:hypothetical protein